MIGNAGEHMCTSGNPKRVDETVVSALTKWCGDIMRSFFQFFLLRSLILFFSSFFFFSFVGLGVVLF